jgi:hypothetical protein
MCPLIHRRNPLQCTWTSLESEIDFVLSHLKGWGGKEQAKMRRALQERYQARQTNFRRDSCPSVYVPPFSIMNVSLKAPQATCMAQSSSACMPNSISKVCCPFLRSHSTLTCAVSIPLRLPLGLGIHRRPRSHHPSLRHNNKSLLPEP